MRSNCRARSYLTDFHMMEPKSELLRIRLTPSQLNSLTEAAAASGAPSISDYIRAALFRQQEVDKELAAIRALIIDYHGSGRPAGGQPAVAVETLLLLRSLVPPATLRTVQAEMQRLGIAPAQLNKS